MNLNMFPLLDTRDNKALALELITLAAMAGNTKRETPTWQLFGKAGYSVVQYDGTLLEEYKKATGDVSASLKQEMSNWGIFSGGILKNLASAGSKITLDHLLKKLEKDDFIQPFSAYISKNAFELLVKHDNTFQVQNVNPALSFNELTTAALNMLQSKTKEREKGGFLYCALDSSQTHYALDSYRMRNPYSFATFEFDAEEEETGKIIYETVVDDDAKPSLCAYLAFESQKCQEDAETRTKNLKNRVLSLMPLVVDKEDLSDYQEDFDKEDHDNRQKALRHAVYAGKSDDTTIEENRTQILINSAILVLMFHLKQISEFNNFMKKVIVFEMMQVACVDDLASESALTMMKHVSEIFGLPEKFVDDLLLAFKNNDRDSVIQLIEE